MSSNAIFSDKHGHYPDRSLHDEIEKVLVDLNQCLASVKRIAERSPNSNFQEGIICLTLLHDKIAEKSDGNCINKQALYCC